MNTQELWEKYFVKTSFEAGKMTDEEGNPKQAAYSLYTAFYESHREYSELESDLIKSYFGEKELRFEPKEGEALNRAVSARFGERANPYIEGRPVNDAQQRAIKNGLIQPVTLVQGPPGTGKTEMILNFLAAVTRLSPESRVAVVSCNAEALRNITDALEAIREQAIMVKVCTRCAILGNAENRRQWKSRVDRKDISDEMKCIFKSSLLETYPIFTSTIHSLPKIFSKTPLFDYVIIDECSQVSVSLGLVAMAYAKHLMLVGDNLQLQAIISGEAQKKAGELRERARDKLIYFEEEGKSFLRACEMLFPGAPNVLLNQHYRCHQSIANFCSEYVYAPYGSKLDIRTNTPEEEIEDCRIDITWYDGSYMEVPGLFLYMEPSGFDLFLPEKEKQEEEKKDYRKDYAEKGRLDRADLSDLKIPSQKSNFRQVDIFMEEMLPELKARLGGPNPPTVCVLAPFRLPLWILQKRLEKELSEKPELNENAGPRDDSNSADSSGNEFYDGLPSLSIHKAQGKGYDIVYLLTVEDNYDAFREPWGQNMRIINVAVSRAKKELHIITSRIWIPQYIQRRLPEFREISLSPMPRCIRKQLGEKPDEKSEEAFYHNWIQQKKEKEEKREKEEKGYQKKENFYVGRLCQWVYDNWGTEEQVNRFGRFGFHKTETGSLFDRFDLKNDAHEMIRDALMDCKPGLDEDAVETGVSLNDIPELAEELRNVGEPNAKLPGGEKPLTEDDFDAKDFILVCKDNHIKAIIHVFDSDYRDACKEKYGFYTRLKSRIDKTRGRDKYIEIPTNSGSPETLEKILERYDASADNLPFEEMPAMKLLKGKTRECLDAVVEVLYDEKGEFRLAANADGEENSRILDALKLNYASAEDVTYVQSATGQALTQQYYLCRYGMAYAFEYALMYDIVFRCAGTKAFRILSLGCGSCIDALAAVYSRDRLGKEMTLAYQGIDRVKWDVSFLDGMAGWKRIEIADIAEQDIAGYFEDPGNRKIDRNVIFFPKILNELDEESRNRLLEAVGKCSLDTAVDEYYFCVSHSKARVFRNNASAEEKDSAFIWKLIDALGNQEQYSRSSVSSFFDFDGEENEDFRNRWGMKKEKTLTVRDGICSFDLRVAATERIRIFNADFADTRTDKGMSKIVQNLKNRENTEDGVFRHRITRVNEMAFQIVRLKKI